MKCGQLSLFKFTHVFLFLFILLINNSDCGEKPFALVNVPSNGKVTILLNNMPPFKKASVPSVSRKMEEKDSPKMRVSSIFIFPRKPCPKGMRRDHKGECREIFAKRPQR
uniref:Uncharacterized protein n=1 Tax=Riptortus pedestris TaxID=329032 RepID=R4WDZ5_RIPPE|nr:unknown secreted protein [Riptortus pedestris]